MQDKLSVVLTAVLLLFVVLGSYSVGGMFSSRIVAISSGRVDGSPRIENTAQVRYSHASDASASQVRGKILSSLK